MKSIWGALALGASCLIISPAAAQDCPANKCPSGEAKARIAGPVAPATTIADDDKDAETKEIKELEKELNKVLLVDESGKIVLREEVKGMLPIPAERVEAMLGTFVELKDGKIKVKDIEMVRPYLPMIRRFLKQGGLERLKNTPPERRDAMKKMLPKAKPPTERPVRPKRVRPAPRRARPAPRRARPAPRRARRPAPKAPQALERRLARIERSLARIERMMGQMSKLHGERLGRRDRRPTREGRDRDRSRGWGRRGRNERRGWNRRDRGRDRGRWERRDRRDDRRGDRRRGMPDLRRMFERGGRMLERGNDMRELRKMFERFGGERGEGGDLRRMFERFRDEFGGERGEGGDLRRMFERFRDEFAPRRERRERGHDDDDDDDRGARRTNPLERSNVFAKGFGKLHNMIKKEDRALVLKAMETMLRNANPGDMGKPEKMLETFRSTLGEDEMARLMELFGEFSSTDEGQAMQQELQRMGTDVEGFMKSDKGAQLGQALKHFQKRLGGDPRVSKKIEKLMGGRRGWSRSKRRAEKKKDWTGPRNPKAKLY